MSDIFQGKDLEKALAAGLLSQDESMSKKPLNKAYQGVTSQNTPTLTPKETVKERLNDRHQETPKETYRKRTVRIPEDLAEAFEFKYPRLSFNQWVSIKMKEELK